MHRGKLRTSEDHSLWTHFMQQIHHLGNKRWSQFYISTFCCHNLNEIQHKEENMPTSIASCSVLIFLPVNSLCRNRQKWFGVYGRLFPTECIYSKANAKTFWWLVHLLCFKLVGCEDVRQRHNFVLVDWQQVLWNILKQTAKKKKKKFIRFFFTPNITSFQFLNQSDRYCFKNYVSPTVKTNVKNTVCFATISCNCIE